MKGAKNAGTGYEFSERLVSHLNSDAGKFEPVPYFSLPSPTDAHIHPNLYLDLYLNRKLSIMVKIKVKIRVRF